MANKSIKASRAGKHLTAKIGRFSSAGIWRCIAETLQTMALHAPHKTILMMGAGGLKQTGAPIPVIVGKY